jgi:hypothetical protein
VLILAWHNDGPYAQAANGLINDRRRLHLSSPYIRLETLLQAAFHRNEKEAGFYENFFRTTFWVDQHPQLVSRALRVGAEFGLKAMDALHIAAAFLGRAEEFITIERARAPLRRVKGIKILTLRP